MHLISRLVLVGTLALGARTWGQTEPHSDPMERKREWEAKLAEIGPGASAVEFEIAVRAKRGFVPHIQEPIGAGLGWLEGYTPRSGMYVTLDEDWIVVRESALPANDVDPAELRIPATEKGPLNIHVPGLPDVRALVDPASWEAVRIIHRSPSASSGYGFDPVNLIRAVNTLQAMGEERAIAAMRSYLELERKVPQQRWLAIDSSRLFLIARLLYVPGEKTASLRPPGLSTFGVVFEPSNFKLFPLAIQDDIPFCVKTDYDVEGLQEAAWDYVNYCHSAGKFREAPLVPRTTPEIAADALISSDALKSQRLSPSTTSASPGYLEAERERLREQIRKQALCAAGQPVPERSHMSILSRWQPMTEVEWREVKELLVARHLEWDARVWDFRPRQ